MLFHKYNKFFIFITILTYIFLFFNSISYSSDEEDFIKKAKNSNNLKIFDNNDFFYNDKKEENNTKNEIKGIDYSSEEWIKTRKDIEEGKFNNEIFKKSTQTIVSVSTMPAMPAPQVEFLDSGTSLSVTGRKVITLNYNGKKYLNPQTHYSRPQSISSFDINQEMQVRMQGKVGEKINVNVDYDDTKADKQDISIIYQGDPNEVVQNISFGDIDLSLPATEFVSYNKQLFGIRADLKTNHLKFTFVGSRTKGETKTTQFIGNTQFKTLDILDTNYIRRRYYDISFNNTLNLPIKAGSESIYIDRQDGEPVDNIIISSMTADDLALSTVTYTGRFKKMVAGIDYVIDYLNGILTFNSALNSQDVVIINYQTLNGNLLSNENGTGRFKIIKTINDIYISTPTEKGWQRELKTYYSIGQTNIVRDNGQGNFKLSVQDLNRIEIGRNLNPPQYYPDTINVDFEQGIFNLKKPFASETDPTLEDSQIYSPSPISKRIIHLEYYYRIKTFMLQPSIVLNSEIIRLDGAKLQKNVDYYIDYESGFVTFYYPDRIGQNSVIDINYEVSPLIGTNNQSLLGGRISYDFTNFSIGSSLLYQGNVRANTTPNINELASSIFVYESDIQLKNLNLLGIRSNLSAEIAKSKFNPNLNNYAIIDNMEGSKQEDSATLDHMSWKISSNPNTFPSYPNSITWTSYEVNSTDINPYSPTDAKQVVLEINYDLSISNEVSLVYPFSTTGLDFSKKNSIEMTILGDNSNNLINLHFGQINEDSDNSSGMTLNCAGGNIIYNAPKTEDINCDGQLSSSEDIGWNYSVPSSGWPNIRFGANNGRIDTQDLNANGRMDSQDFTGGDFGYFNNTNFIDNSDNTNKDYLNFNSYHTWIYPLVIASTDAYKWSNIKQVRLSIKKATGGAIKGTIKISRLAAVGNNWDISNSSNTENIKVLALNNIDDPNYVPIYNVPGDPSKVFEELYGSVTKLKTTSNLKNISEQSLQITYSNFNSSSTAYVYRRFTKPIDITSHKKINFLLYSKQISSYDNFYLKFGGESNYNKITIPLDFTGWRLYSVEQKDFNKDSIPDIWVNNSPYSLYISSSGTPSLQEISMIITGVETSTENASGIFYLNDIYVQDPVIRNGTGQKLQGDFEIPSFASFGAKYRYMDRNFQTPVTVITNQDNTQENAYLNLSRPSFFPTSYNVSKQKTKTPNTYLTGNNNLVNFLQQGTVNTLNATASGNLSLFGLPSLGLNFTSNRVDYDLQKRKDSKDIYSANTNFNPNLSVFIIPKNVSLNYSYTRNLINYENVNNLNSTNYNSDERTYYYLTKLSFNPFKGTFINPGYSLTKTEENRSSVSNNSDFLKYPKSLQQTAEINGNFNIFNWLNPSFNYSINTLENNNLSTTTITMAQSSATFNIGEIKTINRTSQGAINLTLNINDLMPKNKVLRSFVISSSYQLQDGDVWQNVEKSYNSQKYLWIRNSLKPKNPFAIENSYTFKDSYNSTQRWQPFEGFIFNNSLKSLNTISLTNNFTLSKQKTYTTGTLSRSENKTFPDLIFSISQLEKITRTENWLRSCVLNLKHSKNYNEIKTISLDTSKNYGFDLRFNLLNFMDTSLSYNQKKGDKKDLILNSMVQYTKHQDASLQGTFDIKKFILTPKVDFNKDYAKGTLNTVTQDVTQITPSLLVKLDLQAPKGLKLPFSKNTLLFTNRIIWTNTLSYNIKKSAITITDNSRLLSISSVADYEASKNLRISLNSSIERFWSKFLKEEDYLSYQIGSTLSLQF